MQTLEKKLLIAAPTIEEETLFHRSLVFIDAHDKDCTIGFIVNKPSDVKLSELLSSAGIEKEAISPSVGSRPVYIGGPVNTSRMYILYMDQEVEHEAELLGNRLMPKVSSSDSLLKSIGSKEGPARFMVMLGCSTWEDGQLEKEYREDAWISVDCLPEIIFDAKADERIMLAASHVGFDINMMVATRN